MDEFIPKSVYKKSYNSIYSCIMLTSSSISKKKLKDETFFQYFRATNKREKNLRSTFKSKNED
ncbi:hypothetical protein BpHYR1_031425 [Brachionus plicatilis]|uniref:Uncharacterized protein n=1 Tax=Brachionus plicatilis TaxID=10195 RepID=A0A3M7SWQ9_BRAPC|nr:hypothetical protein BpHYR1_031425 [Brachionus plicatilis]